MKRRRYEAPFHESWKRRYEAPFRGLFVRSPHPVSKAYDPFAKPKPRATHIRYLDLNRTIKNQGKGQRPRATGTTAGKHRVALFFKAFFFFFFLKNEWIRRLNCSLFQSQIRKAFALRIRAFPKRLCVSQNDDPRSTFGDTGWGLQKAQMMRTLLKEPKTQRALTRSFSNRNARAVRRGHTVRKHFSVETVWQLL